MNPPHFTDEEVEDLMAYTISYKRSDKSEVYAFALQLRDAIEDKNYRDSIAGVWNEAAPWQDKTFPLATLQSIANHLVKEAEELAEKPDDAVEVADILFLIGHWCHKTKNNIWAVMRNKLRENMGRTWGEVNEQGFVEHVREEQPKHVVHYMKIDKNGNPYGIGSTEEGAPVHIFIAPDGTAYALSSKSHAVKENWQELADQEKDHWEPVVRDDGVKGRVYIYYKSGRRYARVPEYDTE